MFYSSTNLDKWAGSYRDGSYKKSSWADISNITYGNFFSDCVSQNLSSIALVGSDTVKYFGSYTKSLGLNYTEFSTADEVYTIVSNSDNDSFCFAMEVNTFDIVNANYDI